MEQRICVFYNPQAGKKDQKALLETLAEALQSEQISMDTYNVLEVEDIASFIRERANGYCAYGIAGGDGTLRDFLAHLVQLKELQIKLLILPMGTGNDFIRSLDPQSSDPVIRIKHMVKDDMQDSGLYLGNCNGEIFASVSSVGIDAQITLNSNHGSSKTPLSYILTTFLTLFGYRPKEYLIRYQDDEGEKILEGRYHLIAVGNSKYYGRGMKIVPNADPMQSQLGVCLLEAMCPLKLMFRFPTLFQGTHIRLPYVRNFLVNEIEIRQKNGDLLINIDGDVKTVKEVSYSKVRADHIHIY